jgi:hypothetical protein
MILGFVKKLNGKDGKSKKPPYKSFTAWSMIMENQDGSESGWISLGFERPSFQEGQWANYETNAGKFGLELVKFDKTAAPATPVAAASQPTPARTGGYVDRNDSIVYQSSRKDALALVGLLLEHNGLPMSSSAAKAGIASRYEEITAFVDKLTVELYNDVQSLRVLREVVDAGAEAEPAASTSGAVQDTADND